MDERDLLEEMLEFVSDEVEELGNENEIAHIERIMREGTGADRQLMVWERTQDMKAVVDQIVAETNEGLNRCRNQHARSNERERFTVALEIAKCKSKGRARIERARMRLGPGNFSGSSRL